MDFWRLTSPNYSSDYEHSHINGSLDHPYGLPGVTCDVCQQTWSGSRILPRVCPQGTRSIKEIADGWPISRLDHAALQTDLMRDLSIEGEPFVDLHPGDRLQPCFLDVPTRPRADFLWSSLGSLVVSSTIRDLLLEACPEDIFVCQVIPRRIGDREASDPPSIPESGEPEDIMHEVPLVPDMSTLSSYFEVVPRSESKYPPGGQPVSICSGCRRPSVDNSKRRIVMTPDMWQGQDLFYLATTLYIVGTDKLKSAIERCHATNVRFEPAGVRIPDP